MLKRLGKIFHAEIILLLRQSQEWLYPLGFFIIVISFFPLAFTPDAIFQKIIFPVVFGLQHYLQLTLYSTFIFI